MKPIKKFSTEMNQPKSILESLDSKALDELIKGMGFKDVHELKREKNLLAKLEALLKEVNPKQDISEDDADAIEDDINKKGEPKSLEDKTGEKEPEVPVGDKEEEIAEEEHTDDQETEEESDEDEENSDSDSGKNDTKVEIEVEVEDSEKEEESAKTPKATRKIMTFEDFIQEETTTVNKKVSYRDDEEEEDNALPVADSKEPEVDVKNNEIEETVSNTKSAVKSFSQFVSEAMTDAGPALKDEEIDYEGSIVVPVTKGDGSKAASDIEDELNDKGKPKIKDDEDGEELVTKDQEITEDPKTAKDEPESHGTVVVKESVTKIKVWDDTVGPDEDGIELLNKLKPNAKVQFIAGDIDPDELDIATTVMKAKDAREMLASPHNEGIVKESAVNEEEVESDEQFQEYAFTVLQNAFGDDFDEEKAQEMVDGLISKYSGDYGAMVGAVKASLAESEE